MPSIAANALNFETVRLHYSTNIPQLTGAAKQSIHANIAALQNRIPIGFHDELKQIDLPFNDYDLQINDIDLRKKESISLALFFKTPEILLIDSIENKLLISPSNYLKDFESNNLINTYLFNINNDISIINYKKIN